MKLCIATFALFAALNTNASIVELVWLSDATFSRDANIAPNQFLEICGPLPAKEKVTWQFEASDGLEFNIHYHVGKEVIYPSKADAVRTMRADFVAVVDHEYCWMWQNRTDQAVSLSVVLKKTPLRK